MTLFVQRLFDGIDNGAVYAAMALALVVVYKATGHLNFAQGEMAMLAAFVAYAMSSEEGLPRWLAFGVAVVGSFVVGALLERALIRPLERRNPLSVIIVTLGLFLIAGGIARRIWLGPPKQFDSPFPDSARGLRVGQAILRYRTVWMWSLLLAALGLIWLVLRATRAGLAFRCVASDRTSAELVGVRVGRVLMCGWGLAAALGAMAGIMRASAAPTFDTNLMLPVLVYAFAAATLGGFDSLGGALVGGLVVAVVETMAGGYIEAIGGQLAQVSALVVIIVVLLVRPTGLFGNRRVERV